LVNVLRLANAVRSVHGNNTGESKMTLQVSVAAGDYDRTRAIFDGRARIEGMRGRRRSIAPSSSKTSTSASFRCTATR
jgi:hypothetical protein